MCSMYFYRKKSKSGEVLQLLESYRNREGQARHKVVVSLGDAGIPEKSWKIIAKYVESNLYGYLEMFDPNLEERRWIDSIVKRVEREGRWVPGSREKTLLGSRDSQEAQSAGSEVVDGVIIDDIEHTHETSLGPELAGLKAWESLELDELLKRFGFSGAQRRAAACSVINRLIDPVSENRLPLWLETSSLPDILGEDCLFSGNDKYYRISDLLYDRQEEIERHLSERTASHFGFQRTYILYDLTNTHFEGECKDNDKAQRGRNKQKRHDCRQVVAGVCFDEHGFILFHKTFEGNMSDSKSLLRMVSQMEAFSRQSSFFNSQTRPLVIVDAGVATKDNVKLLRSHGFSYLVNQTRQSRKHYEEYFNEKDRFTAVKKGAEELEVRVRGLNLCEGEVVEDEKQTSWIAQTGAAVADSSEAEESIQDTVRNASDQDSEPLQERLVLCSSKPRGNKEQGIFSNAEKKFLEGLEKLSVRIQKGRLKDPRKIERAIGAIHARHTRASKYYKVTYEPPKKEQAARSKKAGGGPEKSATVTVGTLTWQRKDQTPQSDAAPDSLSGCYVLRTDRCDMSADELWHLYMTLSKAENGFRALKSECGLRPNYHQIEPRVDAHIFISILAYQLQRFILYTLEQQGDHRNWTTLRRVLQTHTYSTIVVPTNTGTTYRIRKPGIPEECQRHIYNYLGVQLGKLPKSKIVIKKKSTTL